MITTTDRQPTTSTWIGMGSQLADNPTTLGATAVSTAEQQAVLERIRKEEPALYLKFIISLLPRELIMQFEQHRPSEAGSLDNEEMIELAECGQRQRVVNGVSLA